MCTNLNTIHIHYLNHLILIHKAIKENKLRPKAVQNFNTVYFSLGTV